MVAVYCCMESCWKSTASKHVFPNPAKNMELFKHWVRLTGNKRLVKEMTPETIYKNCRVCSLHFKDEDFGPNRRLQRGVIPSLKLPTPLQIADNWAVLSTSNATVQPVPSMSSMITEPKPSVSSTIVESVSSTHHIIAQTPSTSTTIIEPIPSTSKQAIMVPIPSPSQIIFESGPSTSTVTEPVPSTSKITEPVPSTNPPSGESLTKTPSKSKPRSEILSEISVSTVEELTPKAKYLFKKVVALRRKASYASKAKLSLKRKFKSAEKFIASQAFEKAVSSMDRIKKRFFMSQIENSGRKPRGRRYSIEDKVLALALYKQSATAYRNMSKLFCLPSRKTVMKMLNRIPIKPGLHEGVFSVLRSEARNFRNPLDKYCVLMFDEMSIQAHLRPNFNSGNVDGFEDFGYKRTEKVANHSQVFMIRGIRRKWKQPVYYNFVNGATKKLDIVNIIKLIVRKCQEIGLNIIATVCDQGSNNQAAINYLINETEGKYKRKGMDHNGFIFEIDDQKIVPLFDVPHLFKGLRNSLLKYNLLFIHDGIEKIAKWNDIHNAYKMDPYLGSLRLIPKVTDRHVNPEKLNKMKVSCCSQVFSHSMAVAINVHSFSGLTIDTGEETLKLEKSAAATAVLVEFLDQLFDSLNGSTFGVSGSSPGKVYRTAVTRGTPHLKFWEQATEKLKSFKFLKNGKHFTPPSLKNLIKTIENFKVLFYTLQEVGFNYLMPRSFNQDPIENFFCKMRQKGQRNTNPTTSEFSAYYKSLLVNGLTSGHSVGANCEEDNSEIFLTLQRLVTQGLPEEDEELGKPEPLKLPDSFPPSRAIEIGVLRYVSGYVAKKVSKKQCICSEALFADTSEQQNDFMKFKEYDNNRRLKYTSAHG